MEATRKTRKIEGRRTEKKTNEWRDKRRKERMIERGNQEREDYLLLLVEVITGQS